MELLKIIKKTNKKLKNKNKKKKNKKQQQKTQKQKHSEPCKASTNNTPDNSNQQYPRDRHDPRIPKLCLDTILDT